MVRRFVQNAFINNGMVVDVTVRLVNAKAEICPINCSALGARSLNIAPPAALKPPNEFRVERFGQTCCAGDKVMQVANDDPASICKKANSPSASTATP